MDSLELLREYMQRKNPSSMKCGGKVKKYQGGGIMEGAQAIKQKYDAIMSNIGMATGAVGGVLGAAANQPDMAPNQGLTEAAGAFQGASIGSKFGPLGIIGGAVLGKIAGKGTYLTNQSNYDTQEYLKNRNYMNNHTVDQSTGYYQQGGDVQGEQAIVIKDGNSYFTPPMPMGIKTIDPNSPYQHIQTEKGEMMMMMDGGIVPTKATKLHKNMKKDEVTDIVPVGTFVFSDFDKKKLKKEKLDKIKIGHSPVQYSEDGEAIELKESSMGDYMTKAEQTPAEIAKNILSKFPISSRKKDIFADITNEQNRVNRLPYLAKLVELNGSKKTDKQIEQYQSGGKTTNAKGQSHYIIPPDALPKGIFNEDILRYSTPDTYPLDIVGDVNYSYEFKNHVPNPNIELDDQGNIISDPNISEDLLKAIRRVADDQYARTGFYPESIPKTAADVHKPYPENNQNGGFINQSGYTPGFPSYKRPYNIIDTKGTGNITMKNTPFPVLALPDKGDPRLMLPGEQHTFQGANYVTEIPDNSYVLPTVDISSQPTPIEDDEKDLPTVEVTAKKSNKSIVEGITANIISDIFKKMKMNPASKKAIAILDHLKKKNYEFEFNRGKGLDFSSGLSKKDAENIKKSIDLDASSNKVFKLQQGGPVIKPNYPIDIYKQLPKAVIPPYAKFPIEDPRGSGNYRYATEQEIEEINRYIQDSERENIKGDSGYSYPTGEENNYEEGDIYEGSNAPTNKFRTDDPYFPRHEDDDGTVSVDVPLSSLGEESVRRRNRAIADSAGISAEDEDFLNPDYYGPPEGGYRITERDNRSVWRESDADRFKDFPPKIDRLPGGVRQEKVPIDISKMLPSILPGVSHERDVRRSYNPPSDRVKKEKLQKPPKGVWIIPPGLPGMSPITVPFPTINRWTKKVIVPKNKKPSNSESVQPIEQVPEQGYRIDSLPIYGPSVGMYSQPTGEVQPTPQQGLYGEYQKLIDNYKGQFKSNSNYGRAASAIGHGIGALGSATQNARVDPTLKSTKFLRQSYSHVPQYLKDYQVSTTQKPLDTLARNLGRAGYSGNQLQAILSGAAARTQDATNRSMYQYNMNDVAQDQKYNMAMQGVEDFNNASLATAGNEQRGLENAKLARTVGYLGQGITRDASLRSKGLETQYGLDKQLLDLKARQIMEAEQAKQYAAILAQLKGQ